MHSDRDAGWMTDIVVVKGLGRARTRSSASHERETGNAVRWRHQGAKSLANYPLGAINRQPSLYKKFRFGYSPWPETIRGVLI
jgi:hypothetical protein